MDVKAFGPRLKELREKAGLTQTTLAEKVGVKRDAIARWEASNREPLWSHVLALASALSVSCEAFRMPPEAPATNQAEEGCGPRPTDKKKQKAEPPPPPPPAPPAKARQADAIAEEFLQTEQTERGAGKKKAGKRKK